MKKNSQLQDLLKKYSASDKFDKNSFIAEFYNLLLETKWAKEAKETVRKRQHSEYYLNECSNIEDGDYKQEFALGVKLMTIIETCLKLDHHSDDSSYFLEFMLGVLDDESAGKSELIARYNNLMSTLQAFQIKKHFKSQLYKTLERSKHLDIVFNRKRNSTRLLEQIVDDWEKAESKLTTHKHTSNMNYKELVLNSLSEDNRQHPDRYFYREWKKAEKEFYDIEEFFDGCYMIINKWKKVFKDWQFEQVMECNDNLVIIRQDRMTYPEDKEKSKDEQKREDDEYWCAEMDRRRGEKHIYNINMPISQVLGEVGFRGGHWNYKHIEALESAISKARARVLIDDLQDEFKAKASITESPKTTIKGFNTSLQPEQTESLYSQMKDDYIDCTLDDFKAMFSDSPKPLKWIDKSPKRNQPNKKTIFEFIYLLKEYDYIKKIELNTTATEPNNLYRKLELLFPDLNNFPESNVSGKAEKNTPRKKKLEDIIKSI